MNKYKIREDIKKFVEEHHNSAASKLVEFFGLNF